MSSNFAPAHVGLAPGEHNALTLVLSGAHVEQALAALVQAFEARSGGRLALHLRDDAAAVLRQVPAAGSAPPGLGEGMDALPREESPAWQAVESLRSVAVSGEANGHDPWPACRALMRAHGFFSCCATPLLGAARQALGVLMRYGDGASPDVAEGAEALARTAALLVEHDQRQHQRRETLHLLAHDMRNLLAPLRTALEVLARPQNDTQSLQRLRSIMSRQVAQLGALPEELSRLARSAVDEAVPDPEQLPLPTDDAARGPDPEPPPHAASARRVLVADDNEHVRASFVELLAAEGFEVRTAADGEQAVAIADQWEPDVVLLDIHMPRLSGLETARRLRATHPPQRMTLLMLSGMSLNDAWVRHAKAAGFDDCLDKSADPRAWLARVRGAPVHH